MYPLSLLPKADRKKTYGRKSTYCQRLASTLERFDQNPEIWIKELMDEQTPPPFLRLPSELRQSILYLVLEEYEMSIPRPNSSTRDLATVCKVFAADLPAVTRMWDLRVAATSKRFGYEKMSINTLIKDMMTPIEVASASIHQNTGLASSLAASRAAACKAKKNSAKSGHNTQKLPVRKKRNLTGTLSRRPERICYQSADGPATVGESAEAKRWRRARVVKCD